MSYPLKYSYVNIRFSISKFVAIEKDEIKLYFFKGFRNDICQ